MIKVHTWKAFKREYHCLWAAISAEYLSFWASHIFCCSSTASCTFSSFYEMDAAVKAAKIVRWTSIQKARRHIEHELKLQFMNYFANEVNWSPIWIGQGKKEVEFMK